MIKYLTKYLNYRIWLASVPIGAVIALSWVGADYLRGAGPLHDLAAEFLMIFIIATPAALVAFANPIEIGK